MLTESKKTCYIISSNKCVSNASNVETIHLSWLLFLPLIVDGNGLGDATTDGESLEVLGELHSQRKISTSIY
jgi:hypothetical protein